MATNLPCLGRNRKDIDIDLLALAFCLGAGLILLICHLVRAARLRRAARIGFFEHVAPRLKHRRRAVTTSGFERISGRIDDAEIDLNIVPDMLTYRKLPCFWLLVSHIESLPLKQKISLMVRPTGFETFSDFSRLPCQTHNLPSDFPPDIALRSMFPLTKLEMALLRRHLSIFNDSRIKELVLSPQGCRLTWLLQEAHRGRYLLFREAELHRPPLEWAELARLVQILQDLRHDLVIHAIVSAGGNLQVCT